MNINPSSIVKRSTFAATVVLAAASIAVPQWPSTVSAQSTTIAAQSSPADQPDPLSEDELEVLVARIALYPDELLALISSVSLYPLQIVEASRFLENHAKDSNLKPKESWDGSIVSLLNYPEIVRMMADDLDWTQSFGDAVAYQQKDVLVAIQALRDKAVAADIIKTDDKIKVVQENDNVVIQAADPEKIYVPHYEPAMLYEPDYQPVPLSYYPDPYPNYWYPTATFFAGAVTGAIFASVVDWDNWGVWGGRFDGGDIDIDCNRCMNDIDVNRRLNFNDIDWKNVDRSKINFDKNQFANLDRTSIKNGIEANGGKNLRDRAKDVRQGSATNLRERKTALKDIRANKIDSSRRPGGGAVANRNPPRPVARPDTRRADAGRSAGKIERKVGKPRPAAKRDNRPRHPSGLGEVRHGKVAKVHSQRGGQALGGGLHGGGRPHREFHAGGGSRPAMHRGGGGHRRR
ncbi:DUF3300 domain-containing protein [Rhizobium sp. YS-1r]|uniref:DUF3300 domain-containing protein n=1 Tax=Rhizobium sp. YS-1r TaxID=1532558 RepID=UPI00068CCE50|nr:DUF3300 domain-containing protein [Rhizobium sp. YS-1r]